MKALQLRRPRAFEVVELDAPRLDPARPGQLLVRTRFVSFCGSDTPFFTGDKSWLRYPLRPGAHVHECVGTIAASNSPSFLPGDLVAAIPDEDAGLAELYLADAARAALLPRSLETCGECTLIQPLSTVLYALDQLGSLQGRVVAVIGLGAIGLMFCRLLRQRGAAHVIGIDPLPYRCAAAEALGATRVHVRPASEVAQAARDGLNGWISPDLCIEAVGHQVQTINDCIHLVRPHGEVLAFGVPDQPDYTLDFEGFFRKNAVLRAVVTPPWAEYLGMARDLFMAQREDWSALVTHRFPIHAAARAFDLYGQHADGIVKALLDATFEEIDT